MHALGAFVSQPKCDHFIENEHDAVRLAKIHKHFEISLRRRNHSDPARYWVIHNRRKVAGIALQELLRRDFVVIRHDDDIVEHSLRCPFRVRFRNRLVLPPIFRTCTETDFREVVAAVICTLAFRDLRPVRKGARRLDRIHHGFATGIAKANFVKARNASANQFRMLDFLDCAKRISRAQRKLLRHGFGHRRESVAVDQRRVVIYEVEISISVNIKDLTAQTMGEINWMRFQLDRRTTVTTRQDRFRTFEVLCRL